MGPEVAIALISQWQAHFRERIHVARYLGSTFLFLHSHLPGCCQTPISVNSGLVRPWRRLARMWRSVASSSHSHFADRIPYIKSTFLQYTFPISLLPPLQLFPLLHTLLSRSRQYLSTPHHPLYARTLYPRLAIPHPPHTSHTARNGLLR
jgi:hypothetical protein